MDVQAMLCTMIKIESTREIYFRKYLFIENINY